MPRVKAIRLPSGDQVGFVPLDATSLDRPPATGTAYRSPKAETTTCVPSGDQEGVVTFGPRSVSIGRWFEPSAFITISSPVVLPVRLATYAMRFPSADHAGWPPVAISCWADPS